MSLYALVDGTGTVQNIIEWDGVTPYTPPAGQTAVTNAPLGVSPGWTFIGNTWTPGTLPAQQQLITAGLNMSSLMGSAKTALTNNITYLAIASPSQAQAIAQVAALTRQINAIIRILLGATDSTSGT